VITAAMPWLVLLARSQVYGPLRIAGSALTGIAAAAWFAERTLGCTNPIAPVVETVASHALWLLAGLAILTVAAASVDELNARKQPQSPLRAGEPDAAA
jgi:hypothetical protein